MRFSASTASLPQCPPTQEISRGDLRNNLGNDIYVIPRDVLDNLVRGLPFDQLDKNDAGLLRIDSRDAGDTDPCLIKHLECFKPSSIASNGAHQMRSSTERYSVEGKIGGCAPQSFTIREHIEQEFPYGDSIDIHRLSSDADWLLPGDGFVDSL